MSTAIIAARGLSKQYRRGSRQRADTLAGRLRQVAGYPVRNLRRLRRRGMRGAAADEETTWALRDVDFTVAEGDVLGIIGHNGAGKSTLLKILSRITEPTSGCVDLRGRVSSLLEVGTGFHEELTGRDNVFLNGTILGMRRTEVQAKFDEIVAFSGVAQYIDTPVKFYSSGMKVRLAFAVAAHLEPEILIIDEVLAVGDLAFQEKCLGKMDSVSRSGRTVLFVSHNMGAVEGLCHRCLLLEGGRKTYDGTVDEAIERYRAVSVAHATGLPLAERADRDGGGRFRFVALRVAEDGVPAVGQPLVITLDYVTTVPIDSLQVAVKVCRNFREVLMTIDSRNQGVSLATAAGPGRLRIELPRLDLLPGQYFIDLWAGSASAVEDRIFNAGVLTVADRDLYGSGNSLEGRKHGVVAPPRCTWTIDTP